MVNRDHRTSPRQWRAASAPVAWARLGVAAWLLGRLLAPRRPPLLILSLPRSGSSWAGDILGHAPDALYLREPLTQHALEFDAAGGALRHLPRGTANDREAWRARLAFRGIPEFMPGVVGNPQQWRLIERRRKRVVVKEVNPFAADWLLNDFRPRCLILIRHPAAVATSFARLGWTGHQDLKEALDYLDRIGQRVPPHDPDDFWSLQGIVQGSALTALLRAVARHANSRVVRYETLCAAPEQTFRSLAGWAGLTWTPALADRLAARSRSRTGKSNAYDTHRDTGRMADAWRARLGTDELARLRASFRAFNLPWYAADKDWITAHPASSWNST